jgi:hypothetical protein
MAPKRGRLEAKLTAEAIWQVGVASNLGGTVTVTVLASGASAYPTDLCAALQTALNTAARGTFVVTGNFGESGAGNVSIAQTNGAANPWSLSWSSTNLRRAMGFAGNIASVSVTQTGTLHAQGVWLPDCVKVSPFGDNDPGHVETDLRQTVSPQGHVKTMYGNRMTVLEGLHWPVVTRPKTRQAFETDSSGLVGQSWEQFWIDCVLGELAYCLPGTPLRLYWDADLSTATEYVLQGLDRNQPTMTLDRWSQLWKVDLPRLIKVPA